MLNQLGGEKMAEWGEKKIPPLPFQIRKILFPIFVRVTSGSICSLMLILAQFDASNFARDGLGQIGKLNSSDALEGSKIVSAVFENLAG